jgi:hypothetical protein
MVSGVTKLNGGEVRRIRHECAESVHEIRPRSGKTSSGQDEEKNKTERYRATRHPNASPLDKRPQIERQFTGDHNHFVVAARTTDELGEGSLHAAFVVRPVRHERDARTTR